MYCHGVVRQLFPPTTPSVRSAAPAPALKPGCVSRIAVALIGAADATWARKIGRITRPVSTFLKFIVLFVYARGETLGFTVAGSSVARCQNQERNGRSKSVCIPQFSISVVALTQKLKTAIFLSAERYSFHSRLHSTKASTSSNNTSANTPASHW